MSLVLLGSLRAASGRQRKSLRLYLHKHPAERPYSAVEVGRLGPLQIGKESPDPGRKMLIEHVAIGTGRRRQVATHDPSHDLAENCGMILGLGLAGGAFDRQSPQAFAQARQWPLVQEPSNI